MQLRINQKDKISTQKRQIKGWRMLYRPEPRSNSSQDHRNLSETISETIVIIFEEQSCEQHLLEAGKVKYIPSL